MLSNMRLCPNVPAQHVVATALGGYQSVNELLLLELLTRSLPLLFKFLQPFAVFDHAATPCRYHLRVARAHVDFALSQPLLRLINLMLQPLPVAVVDPI